MLASTLVSSCIGQSCQRLLCELEKKILVNVSKRGIHKSLNPHIDLQTRSFGVQIRNAVEDRENKRVQGTKEQAYKKPSVSNIDLDTLPEQEDYAQSATFIASASSDMASTIAAESEAAKETFASQSENVFAKNLAKERAEADAAAADANDPCFSRRAQKKAYELHKINKDFWNAARLANLFRVRLSRMRVSLWISKIEEQAMEDGRTINEGIDKALAAKFGELDYPGNIADVPERIRFKNQRDIYYYIDDEVKSEELMKGIRNRAMVHYREAPRLPKKSIPAVKSVEPLLASRNNRRTWANRYNYKLLMWDISASKDLYNRTIVVQETDGTLRTGNWQERRYAADYRKTIKWPMKVPHVRPDETEPDHVPSYARVPEGFTVTFDLGK